MIILGTKEAKCSIEVLKILKKGKSKYSIMFRKTKVSHTTLQRVLRELEKKKLVMKHDIGHMKVDYEITSKGKELLSLLVQVGNILG